MLNMEALLLDLLNDRAVLLEFGRDPSFAERDELLLGRPLAVLNNTLTAATTWRAANLALPTSMWRSGAKWGALEPVASPERRPMAGQLFDAARL